MVGRKDFPAEEGCMLHIKEKSKTILKNSFVFGTGVYMYSRPILETPRKMVPRSPSTDLVDRSTRSVYCARYFCELHGFRQPVDEIRILRLVFGP